MVGRVWPRHGGRGRPLNSVVRQHMESARLKLGIVAVLGLLAPVWWTWGVSQLAHGVYLASGSPERPTRLLMWTSVYVPSLVLGLAAGFVASSLSRASAMKGWLIFIGSLAIGTVALAVLLGAGPLEYLESIYAPVGNWFFFGGSLLWPVIAQVRKRAV
jgi:hypothetical protein